MTTVTRQGLVHRRSRRAPPRLGDRAVRAAVRLGAAASLVSSPACALSAGTTVTHVLQGGDTAGAEVSGMIYLTRGRGILSRGEGPVIGGRLAIERRADLPGSLQTHGELMGGYAWAPLPYRAPVGLEILGGVGYGAYPLGETSATAVAFSGRVGVPLRVAPGARPPWVADYPAGATFMLVPSLTGGAYVPLHDGVVRGQIGGELLLRIHFWSSLSP